MSSLVPPVPDDLRHLTGIRESACFEFGEDQLTLCEDIEGPRFLSVNQLRFDAQILLQLCRQTDGLVSVPSVTAITDLDACAGLIVATVLAASGEGQNCGDREDCHDGNCDGVFGKHRIAL